MAALKFNKIILILMLANFNINFFSIPSLVSVHIILRHKSKINIDQITMLHTNCNLPQQCIQHHQSQ